MNILITANYGLYQDLSSSFVHNQARAYAQLGHRVRVIVPIALGKMIGGSRFSPVIVHRQADGVEIRYLRYLSLSSLGKASFNSNSALGMLRLQQRRILKEFTPDVIHTHTLGFDSSLGCWLKKTLGCPLVVTTHGSDTSIPYEQGRLDYLRRCCEGIDAVVAVSSALAAKLKSCGTQTPVYSILNGFNLRYLPEKKEKVPMSFIQVGNLLKQKRADVTLRAFAEVKQDHPEATMTVIGQGPEREALEQLCRELDVSDAVTFTGQLPNDGVLEEMAKAQFFVMPSVREGFGIVYLEAMACGCVTIGTEGEGIADLIVSGENGFLVPADDPGAIAGLVRECAEDTARTAQVAQRGKQDAMGLTWQTNAEKYIELFEKGVCVK